MPVAYSYIRMSRPEQLRGDSLRRQTEAVEKWATARGVAIDDTIRDIGVSAYRGKNRTEGALAEFLRMVEDGRVERGSFLIVESLDRLSRGGGPRHPPQIHGPYQGWQHHRHVDGRAGILHGAAHRGLDAPDPGASPSKA